MENLAVLLPVIGLLVALTNIVTQVLKRMTWDKMPTNVVAVIVAMVLTVAAGIAYCQLKGLAITWYLVVGLIVGGFAVAYAAMFGFDKLKEILNWGDKDG
ncbi:MAG TPA: hypothetical protein IAC25_02535 [Candidatus Enterenecus stercoripullorum]|nr:hypothetical protein [Candidatus Enterenecus stercoripullorum]